MEKFYVVWNPNTCYVGKRHTTKPQAELEAKRLIKEKKVEQFFIFEAIASVENNNIVVKDLFDPVEF